MQVRRSCTLFCITAYGLPALKMTNGYFTCFAFGLTTMYDTIIALGHASDNGYERTGDSYVFSLCRVRTCPSLFVLVLGPLSTQSSETPLVVALIHVTAQKNLIRTRQMSFVRNHTKHPSSDRSDYGSLMMSSMLLILALLLLDRCSLRLRMKYSISLFSRSQVPKQNIEFKKLPHTPKYELLRPGITPPTAAAYSKITQNLVPVASSMTRTSNCRHPMTKITLQSGT